LVGGDTNTAPLGQSMRAHLELAVADDPRIRFEEPRPREHVLRLLQEHDVAVVPSLWECWPYAVLEALQHDRPIIGTPTGGLVEMVQPGRSGWLTHDASPSSLAETMEHVLDARGELESMVREGRPSQVAGELTDAGEVHSRGRYVVPLDADNVPHPSFIERCVEVLERDPDVAFVTSWLRYIDEDGTPLEPPDEGTAPMGNSGALIHRYNVAGDAAAV